MSDKKKRICQMGHEVEKPAGLFGALVGVMALLVLAALASHVVGWIWNIPARLLNAFTVGAGATFLPFYFLAKGVRNLFAGGPAHRLASGQFGGMLGSALILFLIFYSMGAATVRPDGRPGVTFNPTCFTPDKPYYTDSPWELVYRFFFPYGMMFGSGCE
jgi:hypothetical protein